jgi:hypothetical protein
VKIQNVPLTIAAAAPAEQTTRIFAKVDALPWEKAPRKPTDGSPWALPFAPALCYAKRTAARSPILCRRQSPMRLVRSRRCRYAIALLLTFAAWLAGCWCVMPYRPKYSYSIHSGAYLSEISPDDASLLLDKSERIDYHDITNGKRIADSRSDALKELQLDGRRTHAFLWNASSGERFVKYQQALYSKSQPASYIFADDRFARCPAECLSENDRYYAYALQGDTPVSRDNLGRPDHVVAIDLETERQIADLAGTCYPLALSSDGRRALTVTSRSTEKRSLPEIKLLLWDLQTREVLLELPNWFGVREQQSFFTPDSQHAILLQPSASGSVVSWWDMTGQPIASFSTGQSHKDLVLVNGGRILGTLEEAPTYLAVEFWEVPSGNTLGRWQSRVDSLSTQGIYMAGMIGSHDGPYVGVLYPRDKEKNGSRIWKWFSKLFATPSAPQPINDDVELIILDATKQKEVARLPTRYAQFSRDGQLLVTQDNHENYAVYDLPLRRPWARIFGFATIGTLGCFVTFVGLRKLARRKESSKAP